jgi:hypothetical protein
MNTEAPKKPETFFRVLADGVDLIFKAILASEAGKKLTKLVLIGKAGSVKRQNGTGPSAIKRWVKQNAGISVEVKELV